MDFQFYPTPPALARRAWRTFKNTHFTRILEPSAGDGALATAAPGWSDTWNHHRRMEIDACEIDVAKHPILREKGLNVVSLDFLTLASGSIYSHIIMNPPFAEGARHVLKAWELLWDGEIVAIINAETLRNPYSQERQHLAGLIQKHGEAEFIAGAFMVEEAQRKTPVDVAVVYLRKSADANAMFGDLLNELRQDTATAESLAAGYEGMNYPALPSSAIENMVLAFRAAVRAMRDAAMSEARAGYYASLLGDTMAARMAGNHDKDATDTAVAAVQTEMAKRYAELKDRAWAGVLRSVNVTDRLSSAAQKRVEAEFAAIQRLEFTEANIYGFLAGLAGSQGDIQTGMACDVFDLITRYHTDNTTFYRGWKSNDKHRTMGRRIKGSRFVLPYMRSHSHGLQWETTQTLRDFDKVFAMLDGQPEPDAWMSRAAEADMGAFLRGERISATYFDFRYYKGVGTMHFYPKDKKLVDRLNRLVGRHRGWLPAEGERVSDAFWLQYNQAEKLDKEFRREVATQSRGLRYGRDVFWNITSGDEHDRERALALVDAAARAVHGRHGIALVYQLDGPAAHTAVAQLAAPCAATNHAELDLLAA